MRPPMPGAGRFGIMSSDMEQRMTEIYLDSLTDSLLLAGGVALAAAVVASILVSRGVASPIRRLAGGGLRQAHVPPPRR